MVKLKVTVNYNNRKSIFGKMYRFDFIKSYFVIFFYYRKLDGLALNTF